MRANSVVILRDIPQHIGFRSSGTVVPTFWHPFSLETSEETLHRSIVPAVASAAHALRHSVPPEMTTVGLACVMTALIGMKQHVFRTASGLVRHGECFLCASSQRDLAGAGVPHRSAQAAVGDGTKCSC